MLTPSNLTGLDFINKRNLTIQSDLISQDQGQILLGHNNLDTWKQKNIISSIKFKVLEKFLENERLTHCQLG